MPWSMMLPSVGKAARFFLVVALAIQPTCSTSTAERCTVQHQNVWTAVPRLGEAKKPGPPHMEFDNASVSVFSEDFLEDPGSPEDWEQPPSEDFDDDQCMKDDAPSPQRVAERIASVEAKLIEQWLVKHKHSEFVPASR